MLVATIWKCLEFRPEMSGILDTRIPAYCNSDPNKIKKIYVLRAKFNSKIKKMHIEH